MKTALCATLVAVAAPLLAAASCATTAEPIVRTVEVRVPVPVKCVPAGLAGEPAYPDTDAAIRAQPGPAERYQLLAAGRLLRIQRSAETEPIIRACR